MVAISQADRQAACISLNRPESIVLRHADAGVAFDCMEAPATLQWGKRFSVEPHAIPELQCGLIGGAVAGISDT
jgi:hypothetical protein